MTSINKLLTIALLSPLFALSTLQAQNSDDTLPLQEGSKALQFQISDNFNLSSFSGTLFSYKRHLSEDRANRVGLSLNSRYTTSDFPNNNNDRDDSIADINLGMEYTRMHYTNPDSEIKFYYGYGPGVNFGYERSVRDETNSKITDRSALYGISGIGYAGVEWFFHSSISLHAEYHGAIQVNHRRIKQTTESNSVENTNRINTTSFSLGGDGVRFGLSVYF